MKTSNTMKTVIRNIKKEFVVLSPEKKAFIEPADAMLYQRLNKEYGDFSEHELISVHEFSEDWNTWEMHPHGDEVVMLLSGHITMIMNLPSGQESATLSQSGAYIIVPQGVWHTATTNTKSKLLFITPGEGTENKAEPE